VEWRREGSMVWGSEVGMVVMAMLLTPVLGEVAGGLQEGKVCWKSCQEKNVLQTVHMTGCQRRSTFPLTQHFRCTGDGDTGPPCSAQHGGTVHLAITFNHTGLAEGGLRQTAGATAKSGVLSFIEAPWATLDSRACDYLDTSDGFVGCTGAPGRSRLKLPILIESFFPANTYFVQYYLQAGEQDLACLAFPLRICEGAKC